MGNDLVGQVFDAFKEFRPEKTIIKIWNKGKTCLILAAKDPNEWETEMDPYYLYAGGKVDGISFIDNAMKLNRMTKPEYLIYKNKNI